MRFNTRLMVLVALVLCVSSLAFAQTTTTLTGTASTEGNPLPGVTVTISSPSLQGTRTTVTGEAGGYSFAGLPPGNYTIKFELDGLATVNKTVVVQLSQPAKADADLKVSAVAEAITVTAAAPSVLESPQVASTMTAQQIDELPVARTIAGAALLAPGVSGNTLSAGQFVISGSPGYDNLVMVNGVSVTEGVRSQQLNLFIEDAIQETTVLTGGISAEYGRFTGGVINSITKSGGNEFSGSLRDSLQNGAWTNKTPFAGQADPTDKIDSIYEGTLGGYVLKDRLWFFAAGRTAKQSTQSTSLAVNSAAPRRLAAFNYDFVTDETRLEGKLTGQITPKHNLIASYIKVDRDEINSVFSTAFYDAESLYDRQRPDSLATANYNGVLTSNLLVEGSWSHRTMEFVGSGSKFTDLQKGTLLLDQSNGSARFNSPTFCGVCDTESRNNDELGLKANYFVSTRSLGNHNIVAGATDFVEHRYANNHQSGSDYRILVTTAYFNDAGDIFPSFGAGTFFRWTPIFTDANESDLSTKSFYVNDKWDFNSHWSFNVGVRYDKNDAVDGNGVTSSDDQAFSPRLTALYDLKGDGRHRLSASYNTYVSKIVEGVASSNSSAGSPATIDFAYNGPAINPAANPFQTSMHDAIQQAFDWFFAQCDAQGNCGPQNLSLLRAGGVRSIPGYTAQFDGTLQSPAVDEIVLGYAAQIGTNAYAKIDVIKRDWRDFYAGDVTATGPKAQTPLNIPVDLTVVHNTNDITREYKGVQFQAQWRPGRFNTGLNYTWSELTGNDEGENAASGPVLNGTLAGFFPELAGYANRLPEGYLTGDQTHRARAWVGYDVPMNEVFGRLNLSLLEQFDTGRAYSVVGTINPLTYAGAPNPAALGYVAGGTASQNYYFEKRGSRRFEDSTRTDLAINYSKRVFGVELFAQAEVFNLFDESAIVGSGTGGGINTTVTTARVGGAVFNADGSLRTLGNGLRTFNPFTQAPVECAQGRTAQQCFDAGANYQLAAAFGQPTGFTAYQLARTYQFSLGLRF